MNRLKRPIGRRVVGVGVGAAMLMLGLAAPAFAAPTITGFTPTSGPEDCVVVITGTDFANPDVTSVSFGGVNAPDFIIGSDTEIWAAVPAGAVDGFIEVEKSATLETASSAPSAFDVTTDDGGCAPTIASFTPTCGTVGTTVTVTGTNLIQHTTGDEFVGARVEFSPFDVAGVGQTATHTGQPESPTTLSVNVPASAETGRIQVTVPGIDAPFTDAEFQVVADLTECGVVEPTTHERSITLALKKHLRARGVVSLTDAEDTLTECVAGVPVKIQRRKSGGGWKGVGSTTTDDTGAYKLKIKDKPGKYRAKAKKVTLNEGADLCLAAISAVRKHRH